MPQARNTLISLEDTPYYHCISRCVRRSFLCGYDHLTGQNHEHRKTWVVERLAQLERVFAIDIAAFAVMSNHLHLVLRINSQQAQSWTEQDVIKQWSELFSLPVLIQRYQTGEANSDSEVKKARKVIDQWKTRLSSLSWFMRCLNEHLARKANKEDHCTGRFWEGRFKSQALLDEAAVLTAMSYVDLNPIRAKMAETPETSEHTSIQQRIRQLVKADKQEQKQEQEEIEETPRLMALIPLSQDAHKNALGFREKDYLELVDWAGRQIRPDKRGAIEESTPPILHRLGLDAEGYVDYIKGRPMQPKPRVMGRLDKIKEAAKQLEQRFLKGMSQAKKLYLSTA